VCGKPEMVTDVAARLEALGIAKEDITFEKY
jgi:ferredoxin-NADP reductase